MKWSYRSCLLHKEKLHFSLIAELLVIGFRPNWPPFIPASTSLINSINFLSLFELSWMPKGTEMEVHEWTGMECYRGREASGL